MPRQKIEDLTAINLRLQQRTLDALDAWVKDLRAERGDPGFNRTDLVREILNRAIAERPKSKTKPAR